MIESSPTPEKIREVRQHADLTQEKAAQMVGRKMRTWRYWEAGTIAMPPEIWELFRMKTRS